MSGLPTDDQGVLTRCPSCSQKNRVAWAKLGESGRCGKCQATLPVVDQPIEVSSVEAFDHLITQSPQPVLVDFWAAWCGPCLMVAPELEKLATSEAGRLVIAKVNTEDLPLLAQRYQVASIPLMALFERGHEVSRTMGARPAEGILQFVEQASGR